MGSWSTKVEHGRLRAANIFPPQWDLLVVAFLYLATVVFWVWELWARTA